MGLNII